MHGVFKGILNGIHERGTGGFLYVKGDMCAYMFPHELQVVDARETLQELLADERAEHVFYVLEERDCKLNLLAYPREEVFRSAEII